LHHQVVDADMKGNLIMTYKTLASDSAGHYLMVAYIDSTVQSQVIEIGRIFYSITEFNPCPGAPKSYSYIGRSVKVNPTFGQANNVRQQPGKNATLIGKLPIGIRAYIEDGPQCMDNMVWWKVTFFIKENNAGKKITGWTAEAQGAELWLVDSR
jgi:hypothetical protein